MKKIFKTGFILCLLCGLLSSMAFAANTQFTRYNIGNTGYNWNTAYGSNNTKATTKANWFINIEQLSFGGASTNGTLGMAHTPLLNGIQAGGIGWAKTAPTGYMYIGWGGYSGAAGNTYVLGVRLDSLITNFQNGYTVGWWNSN